MHSRPMRLVSYNVRYFGHALRGLASTRAPKQRIATRLAALHPPPDLICLQEVETFSLRSSIADRRTTPRETQLESFMGEMERAFVRARRPFPFQAFYFRAHAYRFRNVPLYTTGLAIIVNIETFRVEGHNALVPENITHHHVASFRDRKQSRICAHVRLTSASGHLLHVFNTHLSLPTPFAKSFWATREKMGYGVNQVQEAKRLTALVHQCVGDDPFVVCGDFNSPPGSPVYCHLTQEADFAGAQEALGQIDAQEPKGFPTAGFMRLRMHLDHLFSGGAIRWMDMEDTAAFGDRSGPFHGLSDHVPLIARFQIGP